MNKYKKLIIEVIKFPESQEVMDKEGWFPIWAGSKYKDEDPNQIIEDSSYARVLNESEYILVEKTTADEFNDNRQGDRRGNPDRREDHIISPHDPGDEND